MTEELPKTRAEALARGVARYYTGEPCKHGHNAPRYALQGNCIECAAVHEAKRRGTDAYRARYRTYTPYRREYQRRRAGLPTPTRPAPVTCEVCGAMPTRALDLDHDHTSGAFRGWLCRHCNLALGHVRDSPVILCRLVAYLIGPVVPRDTKDTDTTQDT